MRIMVGVKRAIDYAVKINVRPDGTGVQMARPHARRTLALKHYSRRRQRSRGRCQPTPRLPERRIYSGRMSP